MEQGVAFVLAIGGAEVDKGFACAFSVVLRHGSHYVDFGGVWRGFFYCKEGYGSIVVKGGYEGHFCALLDVACGG